MIKEEEGPWSTCCLVLPCSSSDVGRRKRLGAGAALGDPALHWRVLTRLSPHFTHSGPPRSQSRGAASQVLSGGLQRQLCAQLGSQVPRGLMPKQSIRIIPGGFAGNSAQIQVSAGCLEQEFAGAGSVGTPWWHGWFWESHRRQEKVMSSCPLPRWLDFIPYSKV